MKLIIIAAAIWLAAAIWREAGRNHHGPGGHTR